MEHIKSEQSCIYRLWTWIISKKTPIINGLSIVLGTLDSSTKDGTKQTHKFFTIYHMNSKPKRNKERNHGQIEWILYKRTNQIRYDGHSLQLNKIPEPAKFNTWVHEGSLINRL